MIATISYLIPIYTLSKCPGSYRILRRELKLNSKIAAGKYQKKKNSEGAKQNYVYKMQKFHKTSCYFGENPKRREIFHYLTQMDS